MADGNALKNMMNRPEEVLDVIDSKDDILGMAENKEDIDTALEFLNEDNKVGIENVLSNSDIVDITVGIAGGETSGTTTVTGAVTGMLLSAIPKTDVGSAIKSVAFNDATGAATVTLVSAQAAETPAEVVVKIKMPQIEGEQPQA